MQEELGPLGRRLVLEAANGKDSAVQDSEYMGHETNNESERCDPLLGVHRAGDDGIPAISIRGLSRDRNKYRPSSLHNPLSLSAPGPTTAPSATALSPRTYSIWVRCDVNAEADAAPNAGLLIRVPERRLLFYDN
jgi:hypothetical protein